jgi:hypothetical protein
MVSHKLASAAYLYKLSFHWPIKQDREPPRFFYVLQIEVKQMGWGYRIHWSAQVEAQWSVPLAQVVEYRLLPSDGLQNKTWIRNGGHQPGFQEGIHARIVHRPYVMPTLRKDGLWYQLLCPVAAGDGRRCERTARLNADERDEDTPSMSRFSFSEIR